jgi:PIN domain nuclease of toxin-antitoxin system
MGYQAVISYFGTKVAIFLRSGNVAQLTQRATEQIESADLLVSAMATVMSAALGAKWTREPGDRIIVANAIANNEAPLVTSDRRIHERYPNAIW